MKIFHPFLFLFLLITSATFAQEDELPANKKEFDNLFYAAAKDKIIGNYEEALAGFIRCIALEPKNSASHYEAANLYMIKKDYVRALEHSQTAEKLEPKNPWYTEQSARIYGELHEYEKAAKAFVKLYKEKNQGFIPYFYEAANMYVYANKPEKAIKIYDELEEKTGIIEEHILQKEKLYLSMNKVEKAVDEIKKLIKAYPEELRYKGMLADLLANSKREKEAFKLYQEILAVDPGNGYAHFALAEHYRDEGNQDQAFSELKMGFSSKDVEIKSKLGVLVSYFMNAGADQKKKDEAYKLAQVLIETHPNEAVSYVAYADILMNEKKYSEARVMYLKSIELEQQNFNIWQQLIFCDSELSDHAAIVDHSKKAIELFPAQPVLYFYNSISNAQLKNYADAAASAKEGVAIGTAEKDLQIQLLSTLGDCNHYLGKYKESDEAYEKALALDPDNSYVMNNFSYFLSLRNEKLEKAETMSRRSNELSPNNASYLDTYGWVLFKLNRLPEAADYLKRSLAISPENGEVIEHYADVLYKQGKHSEALEHWKRAKEKGSDGKFLDKKISDMKLYE